MIQIIFFFIFVQTYQQIPKKINRISFGSCYGKHGKKSQIFDYISQQNPDIWIWLGDAVYLDKLTYYLKFEPREQSQVEEIFKSYKTDKCYQNFIQKVPIIGVWDDHDFNINNGDHTNPNKYWMQQLYLDYIDEPKDSLRRIQQGIYISYQFENIKIILLDVRFNKKQDDILGENQWIWLKDQLNDQDQSKFTFICSGTQILPTERFIQETWDLQSKKRLFQLIHESKRNRVVFLSGDVHLAEFLKTPQPQYNMQYNIYEFTSSGMTHTTKDLYLDNIVDLIFPETYQINANYKKIYEKNFGIIDIQEDKLIFKIMTEFGNIAQELTIDFNKPQNEQEYNQQTFINYQKPEQIDFLYIHINNIIEKKEKFIIIFIIIYLGFIIWKKIYQFLLNLIIKQKKD